MMNEHIVDYYKKNGDLRRPKARANLRWPFTHTKNAAANVCRKLFCRKTPVNTFVVDFLRHK
jgi:hypothetical protein